MGRKTLVLPSMLFLLCFAVLHTLVSGSVSPAPNSYYVDNSGSPQCGNSPSGGSEASPWCTITYAVSRINGGDTVYVKQGTYNEILLINRPNGTASNPTIIRTYPGQTATLRGSGFSGSGRIKILSSSYITFDGFEITNFNQGLFVEASSNIVVQNCNIHDVGQEALHVLANSAYITIENCTVHDTRKWQFNGEGIYIGTSSSGPLDNTNNVTIRNNIIYNANDEGIELKPGTHDSLVEGNLVYNVMIDPAFSTGAGAIEVNEATISCGSCAGGVQTWPSNPNHVVRNNIVHNSKTGIRAGTGSTVYNNLIYNTASPYYGVLVDNNAGDSYTRKIYHNTVDIPSSRAIVVAAGTADVRNNIGPSTTNNIATSNNYYVNKASSDYHLVSGSAPINAGLDLTAIVPTDIAGNSRSANPPPDLGAYEFVLGPAPPTNLRVVP